MSDKMPKKYDWEEDGYKVKLNPEGSVLYHAQSIFKSKEYLEEEKEVVHGLNQNLQKFLSHLDTLDDHLPMGRAFAGTVQDIKGCFREAIQKLFKEPIDQDDRRDATHSKHCKFKNELEQMNQVLDCLRKINESSQIIDGYLGVFRTSKHMSKTLFRLREGEDVSEKNPRKLVQYIKRGVKRSYTDIYAFIHSESRVQSERGKRAKDDLQQTLWMFEGIQKRLAPLCSETINQEMKRISEWIGQQGEGILPTNINGRYQRTLITGLLACHDSQHIEQYLANTKEFEKEVIEWVLAEKADSPLALAYKIFEADRQAFEEDFQALEADCQKAVEGMASLSPFRESEQKFIMKSLREIQDEFAGSKERFLRDGLTKHKELFEEIKKCRNLMKQIIAAEEVCPSIAEQIDPLLKRIKKYKETSFFEEKSAALYNLFYSSIRECMFNMRIISYTPRGEDIERHLENILQYKREIEKIADLLETLDQACNNPSSRITHIIDPNQMTQPLQEQAISSLFESLFTTLNNVQTQDLKNDEEDYPEQTDDHQITQELSVRKIAIVKGLVQEIDNAYHSLNYDIYRIKDSEFISQKKIERANIRLYNALYRAIEDFLNADEETDAEKEVEELIEQIKIQAALAQDLFEHQEAQRSTDASLSEPQEEN